MWCDAVSRQGHSPTLSAVLLLSLLATGVGPSRVFAHAPAGRPASGTQREAAAAVRGAGPATPGPAVERTGLWVPGGTAALLASAGLERSRPRATAMLDVVRAVHEVREGVTAAIDQRRASLLEYLETLSEFERACTPFRARTVRLSLAEKKPTRKVLEDLASALGSSLEQENHVYRLRPRSGSREQRRREWLLAAGFDVSRFEAALNSGQEAPLLLPGDEVPLPLPEPVWRSLPGVADRSAGPLVASILTDRRASLLYYGLFPMDEETRRYLAATPALVAEIYESDRSSSVALCGRSLRIRGGRIETPGGSAATSLWEALADERVTRPDRFILNVLGKDRGRLALLYDAVAHLDASRQAFALGLWIRDPGQRLDAFRALYSASLSSLSSWDPVARPFARGLYDAVQLLMLTPVMPDGRPRPISWRKLWDKAFDGDGLPDRPEQDLKNLERDGFVDAAWLVATLSGENSQLRRNQSETWLFGQRVFRDAPGAAMPQLLVVLRGYDTFRALADTLERAGISQPDVYVTAFRQAQRVTLIGDPKRAATALGLFQGALVLVERARLSRAIDAGTAARLVASLSRLELSDDGEFLGAVAFWIDAEYLPAIGRPAGLPFGPDTAPSAETHLLRVLAGLAPGGAPSDRTIEHEGRTYRLDPVAPELARLQAVRAKQGGTSLDNVMAFAREVQGIASGIGTLAQIPSRVAALRAAAAPLVTISQGDEAAPAGSEVLAQPLAGAVTALGKIRKAKDLAKTERIAVPLRRSIDRLLAPVLMSLAYACNLGDPDSTALLAGDPSGRHDWKVEDRNDKVRLRAAWALPAETRDAAGRWRVTGSLLALDVGLGQLALRRISADDLPRPPTILDNDRRAFTEAVALANIFDYRDADMALIADALRRGRARVAGLAAAPALLPQAVTDGGVDELRQQALAWALVHEPDRVASFFSLGELLRLGQLPVGAVEALDAWGTSGLSFDGCLCLRFPLTQPWATLSGRRGKALSSALVPDLVLMIAEMLHDQRLPAMLTRAVLAAATADVVDRLALAFEDDWMAMVEGIQRIVPPRMDDYLASVMTSGPLVPIGKNAGGGRVP